MRILMGLILVTGLVAGPAQAMEFQPAVQGDLRFGHETQPLTAADNFAWAGQLVLLPAIQWSPSSSFLPLFAYLRQDSDVVVEEDSFFTEQDSFLARPLYRRVLNDAWDLKAWGDARRNVTMESYQQAWSTGLYDYEEYGGGVGAVWKARGSFLGSLDLALELLHRAYPNWHELSADLIHLTDGSVENYYNKDYVGYKGALKLLGARRGAWAWNGSLDYLYRAYTDALVEQQGGFIPGADRRQDQSAYLEARLVHSRTDWVTALSLDVAGCLSNQNYVDTGLAVYVPGINDYLSQQLGLALTYAPQGTGGPAMTTQVSLLNRDYQGPGGIGRNIRNPDGTFAMGKENDVEQRYHLDGRWPLLGGLAVVANLDYTVASSNQSLFNGYQPNYVLFQILGGLQYNL